MYRIGEDQRSEEYRSIPLLQLYVTCTKATYNESTLGVFNIHFLVVVVVAVVLPCTCGDMGSIPLPVLYIYSTDSTSIASIVPYNVSSARLYIHPEYTAHV